MSLPKIYSLKIGYSNSVLIRNGNRSVLVDTGVHGFMLMFQRYFKHIGVQFSDIQLIILTHVHYDHTGNLKELKRITGARVAVNEHEYLNLKKGYIEIPAGITPATRIISGVGRILFRRFSSPPPFEADQVIENEYDLSEIGIEGKIIYTPGHTLGSQSVIIGKTLLAGDTFLNIKDGLVFPHFVNDPARLLKTWEQLFQAGVEEVYPGHGSKFGIGNAYSEFEKWSKVFSKTGRG